MDDEYAAGFHSVFAALEHNPKGIDLIWIDKERNDSRIASVISSANQAGVRYQRVPRAKLDALVERGVPHQGLIARLRAIELKDEAALFALLESREQPPMLLVLDGIQDPHNLGACIRSAAAAGADAVIIPKDKSAPVNATARKAASGAAETLPIFQVTNIVRALKKLKQRGIWVYGASGAAESDLYQCVFHNAVAIVMGSEQKGLRHGTRQECDQLIRIPMAATVDSLNVSVATGVCLFEVRRQRQLT